MKTGMADYKKVVQGSNETAAQFEIASDNFATSVDKFKERTKNATRAIGDDLASAAQQMLKGDFKGALKDVKHAGQTALENKGTIGTALAGGLTGALLVGETSKAILNKIPGMGGIAKKGGIGGALGKGLGGLAKGAIGGELAKASGATPVYVVNASEIGGGGGGLGEAAGGAVSGAAGASKILSGFGLLGAGIGGLAAGHELAESESGKQFSEDTGLNAGIDKILEMFNAGGVKSAKEDLEAAQQKHKERFGDEQDDKNVKVEMDHEKLAASIGKHFEAALTRANKNKPVNLSNPSRPTGAGSHI
jgi:hypothetical protein